MSLETLVSGALILKICERNAANANYGANPPRRDTSSEIYALKRR